LEIEAFPPSTILLPLFSNQIKEAIENGKPFVGCDVSVKNNVMGVY